MELEPRAFGARGPPRPARRGRRQRRHNFSRGRRGAVAFVGRAELRRGRDKRARQKITAGHRAPDAADNERRQEPPDRRAARLRRAAPPRQDSRIHLQKNDWRGLLHRAPARARDNGALQQPRHDGRERPDNRDGEAHPPRRQQLPHGAARRALPHAAALRRHAARRMARRAARGYADEGRRRRQAAAENPNTSRLCRSFCRRPRNCPTARPARSSRSRR